MRFGISTHLYHDLTLERSHVAEIAAFGFDGIELFATRSHFDYRNETALRALAEWLAETGLRLFSVHAPITERFGAGDDWAPRFSNAVVDNARRQAAVQETEAALGIARFVPFETLIVHVGTQGPRVVHYPEPFRKWGHLRFSVGLEDTEDLLADLTHALDATFG